MSTAYLTGLRLHLAAGRLHCQTTSAMTLAMTSARAGHMMPATVTSSRCCRRSLPHLCASVVATAAAINNPPTTTIHNQTRGQGILTKSHIAELPWVPSKLCLPLRDPCPHLIHCFLGPPESTTLTASP